MPNETGHGGLRNRRGDFAACASWAAPIVLRNLSCGRLGAGPARRLIRALIEVRSGKQDNGPGAQKVGATCGAFSGKAY